MTSFTQSTEHILKKQYPAMVCIGRNVQLFRDCIIPGMLVSPDGQVAIVVGGEENASFCIGSLRGWDADRLDDVAATHFFRTEGQAARVIDAMAREGYLTFSDEGAFTRSVNANLKAGNIAVIRESK